MPPNSTQNLNAKLSLTRIGGQRAGGPAPTVGRRPIGRSVTQTKIVSGARRYRGGYHLNV